MPSESAFRLLSENEINYSTDLLTLQAYSQDQWPRTLLKLREEGPQPPQMNAVVWPNDANQVAWIVNWAKEANVSLYPYGAGSGVCGAVMASPQDERKRVIVDLKAMRKV